MKVVSFKWVVNRGCLLKWLAENRRAGNSLYEIIGGDGVAGYVRLEGRFTGTRHSFPSSEFEKQQPLDPVCMCARLMLLGPFTVQLRQGRIIERPVAAFAPSCSHAYSRGRFPRKFSFGILLSSVSFGQFCLLMHAGKRDPGLSIYDLCPRWASQGPRV